MEKNRAIKKGSYLVFADRRFARDADAELSKIFGSSYSGSRQAKDTPFFVASIRGGRERALARVKAASPAFVDAVIPVYSVLDSPGKHYSNAIAAAERLIGKRGTFKIEAKKLGTTLPDRARDVEVLAGKALEAKGFRADLGNPDRIIYLLLLKDRIAIGRVDRGQVQDYVLDRYRSSQGDVAGSVNRAEFKLREAIGFFGIDISNARRALDIGAAPGGWTHLLLGMGVKVVAVDNALLDYGSMGGKRILVLADKSGADLRRAVRGMKNVDVADIGKKGVALEKYDLVHVKANVRGKGTKILGKAGSFDLLAIDTNTTAAESAGIAVALHPLLARGAHLLMTIKLFNRSSANAVSSAERALAGRYRVIGLKKLPHNRDELTLYARKMPA